MDTVEKYEAAAKAYAAKNGVTSQHIIDIAASILMTRDNVRPGGNFAQAVVNNNLREAIGRADDECAQYLRFFVRIVNNIGSYEIQTGNI